MYYVIKKQTGTNPMQVIGFKVPKYITKKSNNTVIFEFVTNTKTIRKWVKKEEIILLTDDQALYLETLKEFQDIQEAQEKLVIQAQKNLEQTIENYSEVMESKLEDFEEIKDHSDISSILENI